MGGEQEREGQLDPYQEMDIAGVEFVYATNFVTTHTSREFFLTFGCLKPDKPGSKKLRCVARVIIGPEHMVELLSVLRKQVEAFKKLREDGGGESESPGFRR